MEKSDKFFTSKHPGTWYYEDGLLVQKDEDGKPVRFQDANGRIEPAKKAAPKKKEG